MKLGFFDVEIAPGFMNRGLEASLAQIAKRFREAESNPQSARHQLQRLSLPLRDSALDVMVKAYAPQRPWKDWTDYRMGSKAHRAFKVAAHLHQAGVGTPMPVARLERWQGRRLVESYLITEFVEGLTDFRHTLIHHYRHDPHCARLMALLQRVAGAVRLLHDAGVLHRDLGNQNILLLHGPEPRVLFTDLNRARTLPALSHRNRARDISRLALPSDLLRVFKEMYWSGPPPREFERWESVRRLHYRWHDRTRALRHPIRERARRAQTPDGERYPDIRDIWIWDDRSAQPVQVARGPERRRAMPVANAVRQVTGTLRRATPLRAAYREKLKEAFQQPVPMAGRMGIAVEPTAGNWAARHAALRALGTIPVLVRFYRHHNDVQRQATIDAVRELHAGGYPVAIAMVQDRASVRDADLWARFGAEVLDAVHASVTTVEIGHAINRVKWGVWDLRELRGLYAPLSEWRARYPHLEWMGPAGIDFEYPAAAAALDLLPDGAIFDTLSHHLYVDRRGAPEAKQGPFAALEKLALARALAQVHPACMDRLVISEVNWPILGTGVYSPVGSPYHWPGQVPGPPNVSAQDYAAFMVRYLLIALCSGLAERVYWWRLAAHGFGLLSDLDPDAFEARPAYGALRTFLAECGAAEFQARRTFGAGGQGYFFRGASGECFAVAYSSAGEEALPAEWSFDTRLNEQGQPLPGGLGLVGAAPHYLKGLREEVWR